MAPSSQLPGSDQRAAVAGRCALRKLNRRRHANHGVARSHGSPRHADDQRGGAALRRAPHNPYACPTSGSTAAGVRAARRAASSCPVADCASEKECESDQAVTRSPSKKFGLKSEPLTETRRPANKSFLLIVPGNTLDVGDRGFDQRLYASTASDSDAGVRGLELRCAERKFISRGSLTRGFIASARLVGGRSRANSFLCTSQFESSHPQR